jgi:hypothetical protein
MNPFAKFSNLSRGQGMDVSDLFYGDGYLSKSLISAESIFKPGPIVVEMAMPFK